MLTFLPNHQESRSVEQMRFLKVSLSLGVALAAFAYTTDGGPAAAANFVQPVFDGAPAHLIRVHSTDGRELVWRPRDNLTDIWSLGQPGGNPDSFDQIYERARIFGDAISELRLGLKYYKGEGVKQDFAAAAKWLRLSAQQGNHTAQAILGYQYYSGAGVPRDLVEAHLWVTLALETLPEGRARASVTSLLASIEKELTPDQRQAADQKVRDWYSGMTSLE
jgi:TPR repeat protein